MNKDIIYIDVEDDITAIIGKIKASKEKIVALVPPKRVGILQSAVNLQLLARSATNSHKHLVLITNNQALIALTAIAKIPVAKNLQSKPEIAEIAALEIDDGEDVIDGSQLPVGEIAKTADVSEASDNTASVADVISTIDIDNDVEIKPEQTKFAPQETKTVVSNHVKVPDFSRFRKRLFIGALIIPFLIWFLVWAVWFAPSAKVIITAKTSPAPVSKTLQLGGSTATDVSKGIIQTVTKQLKKDVSVDFTATGKKKLGDKATGTITISNADSSNSINVPSGSVFSDGSYDFTTTTSVRVPGATVNHGIVPGTIDVAVAAAEVGAEYNLAPGDYTTDIPGLTATGTQMSGGSSHDAVVVTLTDIQTASQALVDLSNSDVKQQIIDQFTNGEVVINDSFTVDHAAAVSAPLVDNEAINGKAKLTSSTTFTITAIAKSELEAYLKDAVGKQIVNPNTERIYNDGIDKVKLSGYLKTDQGASINIESVGQIGPNIDQDSIKDKIKGLKYGDVQALISSISGVDSVDTKFSYFWVNTVPSDVKKIDVEFVIQND